MPRMLRPRTGGQYLHTRPAPGITSMSLRVTILFKKNTHSLSAPSAVSSLVDSGPTDQATFRADVDRFCRCERLPLAHSYAEARISIRDQQCRERYVAGRWYPHSGGPA